MHWERFGLVLGGAVCLFVTPFVALAYYPAYASAGEVPPPWADWITWPEIVSGSPVDVYNTWGTIYGFALLVVAISAAALVGRSTVADSGERRAWLAAVGGLGLAAVGAVFEYALELLPGFFLELLGFLVVIVGMAMVGAALRKAGAPVWKSLAVGISGFVAIAVGGALVGHIPSGPAFVPVIAYMAFTITGLPFATAGVESAARS